MSISKPSLGSYLDGPSTKYEPNYKVWANKSEWKLVGKIRDRIQTMYNARQSSCYLINYDGTKSWDTHWSLLEKDYLMWSEFGGNDDWTSNLKSSISYRTTASLDAKERKQDIKFLIEARNESDESKGRAITYRYMFEDYFRRNTEVRYRYLDVSKVSKIKGTGVAYIPYTIKMREVSMPMDMDFTKEDMEAGKLPEAEFEDKIKVDFEDVDFLPWQLEDFYVDPNAQNLHGTDHPATDAAGILYLTPSQVRLMFQGNPNIKNLDKIGSGSNGESYASPFFNVPKDIEKGYGELIYYYNVETDSEVIIYDDILLSDNPIPYIDKEIPFVAFHFIRHPGQFYGMGVGDVTIQQSSEDSAIKNARLDRIHFTTNPPTLVGASIFGDLDDQWQRMEPNAIIKVGDVSQVKPLEYPTIPFDSFRISEELKDEAVMNTGINPQGMSLPMSSTPATNTLSMKETASDMTNMYADNRMRGMGDWGWLLGSRFSQFYSQPTKKSALELDKKEMRELRLEDIDLYKDDKGNYKHREIKGAKIIPLEKEMFEWEGEKRIYISPDFISPISHAFKMRKAQEVLPQLIQLAGNPGVPSQDGQEPVIDIRKLVKWYLDELDMRDNEFLIDEGEDKVEEIRQAQTQQEEMQEGKEIPGRPGEPVAHRYAHSIELRMLNDTIASDEYMMMIESQDPQMQQFTMALDGYRKDLTEHLRIDGLLAAQASEAAIADADAVTQSIEQLKQSLMGGGMPQQGGQQGMTQPGNNMVNIPTVTGNQGLPNQGGMPVPNKMGQEDVMGQMGGSAARM